MTRTVVVIVCVLLLALCHPLESMLRADVPSPRIAARIGAGRLMGGVLTGSFRPLLLTYLWIRADILYGQGRLDEHVQLLRTMVALYPNNERAQEYLGWSLAFNLKGEAPDEEIAWTWSREGLDLLLGLDGGHRTLADWILKQCGQNALHPLAPLRYAGDDWETEKRWRARLRNWGAQRFGERFTRFELGLKVMEGRQKFYDLWRRTVLLTLLTYEEWVRAGRAPHYPAAIAALRGMAQQTVDFPPLARAFLKDLAVLQAIEQRDPEGTRDATDPYRVAAAFLGIGARERSLPLLRAALGIFRRMEAPEESALVRQWIAYVEAPTAQPRPPLPFD